MTCQAMLRALVLAAPLCWSAAAAAAESTAGRNAVAAVTGRIAAKDCAGAVDELKAGLKRDYAEVSLLAGTMYEHAVCVPHDWNRAVLFYVQAYQSGLKEAADRLAAGYAAPENGTDVAAALWWSGKGRIEEVPGKQPLAPCAASAAAAGDMDRFVAELRTWPQWRLAMCNYVAGVMSTLAAEIEYPALARAYEVEGEVTLRFLPAVPKIELKKGGSGEYRPLGGVNAEVLRDHETPTARGSFEKALGTVAERALRRYPQPGGIPNDAAFVVRYVFELR